MLLSLLLPFLQRKKIFVYSLHSRTYAAVNSTSFLLSEKHRIIFVRFRSIQSPMLSLDKIIEFNHSSCLTSDDKQAKRFSVVGLCLNSITFFSLARLQLKQRCLIGNKALLTSCAVTTPMWFRAWACLGRLITSVYILVSEWLIRISESS